MDLVNTMLNISYTNTQELGAPLYLSAICSSQLKHPRSVRTAEVFCYQSLSLIDEVVN